MANSLLSLHGAPDEAVKELSAALAQCSDLMQARVDRGRALLALGQPADAVADLLVAEKANPDEPTIHFYLANAYRTQGRADDSRMEMLIYKKLMDSVSESESKRAAEEQKIMNEAH